LAVGSGGSIVGNVLVDVGATLAFDRSDMLTFSGTVSGAGSLVQQGSGTLSLTGTNTYTGGTVVQAGTLAIGTGGTAGSIAGDVLVDGGATLAFDRSDAVTFAGSISGGGGLVQQGSGTLTLTGGNSYTGGTTVAAGTLVIGSGGTSGAIADDVVVDTAATLAFNRSDAVTFAGNISGAGSLVQQGSGTLSLTGTNGYTGGTVVQAGTLAIGSGGTAGSIVGDVLVDGGATLAFDRSDAVTFAGSISGGGALVQQGGGTLSLIGTNSYAGGTNVAAGTLTIGNGGTVGAIIGPVAIAAGATFAFDRADDISFAGALSGPGTLIQAGSGTLTLTGSNGQGGTIVEAGTLSLAAPDNLGPGFLSLLGGTTIAFTGSGTYGEAVTLTGDPTFDVAQSQSVTFTSGIGGTGDLVKSGAGTLILDGVGSDAGNATVAAGVLMIGDAATPTAAIPSAVTVDTGAVLSGYGTVGAVANVGTVLPGGPGGAIGVLHVTGAYAQGAGGVLSINVTPARAGRLAVGGTTALAGTVGFSYAAGSYSAAVYPVLTSAGRISGRFTAIAETGAVPDTLLRSVLYKPDEVDLVLSQPSLSLAGGTAIFADAAVTALHDSQEATGRLLDQVDRFGADDAHCTLVAGTCLWADAVGRFATADDRDGIAGFSADTGGFLAGGHRSIDNLAILGAGAGYEHAGLDGGGASAGIDTARVFVYGAVDLAPAVLSASMSYGHDWFETERSGGGPFLVAVGSAHESHDASEYGAGIQLGLPTAIGPVRVDPRLGLAYDDLDQAGFAESGAGQLDITGTAHGQDSLRSFVRLGLAAPLALDDGNLLPRLDLGYARELLTNGAAGAAVAGNPGSLPASPLSARNIVTTGIGLDFIASDGMSLSARYGADVYVGDGLDQTLHIEARWQL
jgi:autotransporter-associated beta strand protein